MKKPLILFLIGTGVVLINILIVLNLFRTNPENDMNMVYRGIDTSVKMWLNGRLGFFFNFEYIGIINWLFIPLLLIYFFTGQFSVLFRVYLLFFLLALLIISVKGFFNMRYGLTVLPLFIFLNLFFLFRIFEFYRFNINQLYSFLVFLCVLSLINFFINYRASVNKIFIRKINSRSDFVTNNPDTGYLSNKIRSASHSTIKLIEHLISYRDSAEGVFQTKLKNAAKIYSRSMFNRFFSDPLPLELVRHINQKGVFKDSLFLVNNLPLFFYYTHQKGVYFWCEDDFYWDSTGRHSLFKGRSLNEVHAFIKNSLKCNYIFSCTSYDIYDPQFLSFVQNFCSIDYIDDSKYYVLYKIK